MRDNDLLQLADREIQRLTSENEHGAAIVMRALVERLRGSKDEQAFDVSDNVSAGGFIQFKAQVPPPAGVLAQINVMARARAYGVFKESGMVIQVYDDAGSIKSRIAI